MDAMMLNILVVAGDRDACRAASGLLAEAGLACRLEWALDAGSARTALAEGRHDVALIGGRIGGVDGLELVREAVAAGSVVPMILLSGRGGRRLDERAMAAGAADHLPAVGLDAPTLARSLRHAVTRRRFEQRLRRSEREARRLALVATHTDNLVIIADAEGRIEWVNDAFVRVSEYTLDEVRGRTPGSVLQGPDTDPATVALMRERVRAGEGFRVEVLNYAKSGRPYWLAIDCEAVRDDSGAPAGFVAIETDVTERHRAAEAARRTQDAIEAAYDATIEGWSRAMDLRDHETEGHSRRVTEMTVRLALAMGWARRSWSTSAAAPCCTTSARWASPTPS